MAVNSTSDSPARVRRAGITLFAERGFHGTGIRDLAEHAGLSSASLYHHMGTKERLLAEIMSTALGRLIDAARQATVDTPDPARRLGMLVAIHVLTHATRPAETRVVDNEIDALSRSLREPIVELRDNYEQLFTEAIAAGTRSGAFRTEEPTVARLALLEMCSGVAHWYSPHGALDVTALAAQFAAIALRVVDAAGAPTRPDIDACLRIVTRVWGQPD